MHMKKSPRVRTEGAKPYRYKDHSQFSAEVQHGQ